MLSGICTEGLFFPVLVLEQWLQPNSINHAYFGDLTDASVSDSCRSGPLQLTFYFLEFKFAAFAPLLSRRPRVVLKSEQVRARCCPAFASKACFFQFWFCNSG